MLPDYNPNMIYGNFLDMGSQAFPIDCETLAAMQNNTQKLAAIAKIAGTPFLILSGCKENGTQRTEGYVYIADHSHTGEILYHPAQPKQPLCHIKETTESVRANGVEYSDAYTTRHLADGPGTESFSWDWFADIDKISNTAISSALAAYKESNNAAIANIKNNANFTFVKGMIMLWSGTTLDIPEGWALCDGTHGTPNLINKFVMGWGSVTQPRTGGSNTVSTSIKLTYKDIPAHRHIFVGDSNIGNAKFHTRAGTDQGSWSGAGGGTGYKWMTDGRVYKDYYNAYDNNDYNWRDETTVSSASWDNRPAYYALAYIMKL